MIVVDVEDYCQQCLDFHPDVTPPTRDIMTANDGVQIIFQTDTIIRCKYRKRCAGIKRYLEQQSKTEVSG